MTSNIIVIVVDTLRKDYAKPLENVLTKAGFVSYDNVIAPASWTTPSHASIFTGQYPIYHGAHETKDRKILDVKLKHKNILSKILQGYGYETYLLSANPLVSPLFGYLGFNHVFEVSYIPKLSLLSPKDVNKIQKLQQELRVNSKLKLAIALLQAGHYSLLLKGIGTKLLNTYPIKTPFLKAKRWPLDKGASTIINKFKRIIQEQNDIKKFYFINLMEVHDPYFIGENTLKSLIENLRTNTLNKDFVKKWRRNYPKEVEYVTKKILEMIKLLKKNQLFEKAFIIVTSDHGQLLGEHRRISHGYFLFDELLKVPLFVKYPKDLNLNIKCSSKFKYISLTKIKELILSVLNNDLDKIELYQDAVFAESHGVVHDIKNLLNEEDWKRIEQKYEKYKIAIYYKNFKGIFNVTDWRFEEIISYSPKIDVTEDIVKHMKKEVVKLLKTAIVAKVLKMKA